MHCPNCEKDVDFIFGIDYITCPNCDAQYEWSWEEPEFGRDAELSDSRGWKPKSL